MSECKNCGAIVTVDAKFCSKCGAAVNAVSGNICPECKNEVAEGLIFCDKCGTKLVTACGTSVLKKANSDDSVILSITWKKEIKNSVKFVVENNGLEICHISQGETITIKAKKGTNKFKFNPSAPKWFGWKPLLLTVDLGQTPRITLAIGSLAGNMLGTWQLHVIDSSDAAVIEQLHG